jgi:hypothetical protein
MKKPSLKGMKHTEYLEHFAQDKFIQQGHNDSGKLEEFIKAGKEWADEYSRLEASAGGDAGSAAKRYELKTGPLKEVEERLKASKKK